jgi:hypothetical protein
MIFLIECFEDLTTYDKFSILSRTTGDQYLDFPQNWQVGNPDQTWMKRVQKKGGQNTILLFFPPKLPTCQRSFMLSFSFAWLHSPS